MENNVFYKTTLPANQMDYDLVKYLENQSDEISDDLRSLGDNHNRYNICYIINRLDPDFFTHSAHGIPGDSFVTPTVILSDRTEPMTYGSLNLDELKKELRKLQETTSSSIVQKTIGNILGFPEEAEDKHPVEDEKERTNRILMEILGSIDRREPLESEADEIHKLLALLSEVRHTCAVYGEYIAKLNLIVLYCKTIRNAAHYTGQNVDSLFTMVLAHEMFHAFHCQTVGENRFTYTGGRTRKLKTQTIQLTEALADFYCVYYLIKKFEDSRSLCFYETADNQYISWKKNLFWSWPYARALYFFLPDPFRPGHTRRLIDLPDHLPDNLTDFDCSFEKFMKVFLSVADDNREEAYRILLEE